MSVCVLCKFDNKQTLQTLQTVCKWTFSWRWNKFGRFSFVNEKNLDFYIRISRENKMSQFRRSTSRTSRNQNAWEEERRQCRKGTNRKFVLEVRKPEEQNWIVISIGKRTNFQDIRAKMLRNHGLPIKSRVFLFERCETAAKNLIKRAEMTVMIEHLHESMWWLSDKDRISSHNVGWSRIDCWVGEFGRWISWTELAPLRVCCVCVSVSR